MRLYFFANEGENKFNWSYYKNWDLFISISDNKLKTNSAGYMVVWTPYFSIEEKTLSKYEFLDAYALSNMPMPTSLRRLLIKNIFEYLDDD